MVAVGLVFSSFGQIEQREFNRNKIDHFNHDNKFELDADSKNRNRLEEIRKGHLNKNRAAIRSSRSIMATSLLDSTVEWEFNGQDSVLSRKSEYTYDNDGNTLIRSSYRWSSDIQDWVYFSKSEYTYDSDGNELSYASYDWSSDIQDWIGDYRSGEYTYDNNGNTLSYTSYRWSSDIQDWIVDGKSEYTYDNNGNTLSSTDYNWDSDAQDWEKILKRYYFYSNSGTASIEAVSYTHLTLPTN